ncbi:N-acetyl-1-D-myo-inositol-2-amino-2-deoxy-alpha-D-glucopyranoside deacetylase [Streptomyces sp. AJS327]|uniref:N-acetyl-1-D-myo-inositol-2-amino-2-deoxy-alpha- D-glucopyranoside deacetylase n=1 Tax=Streptomyces sp. AJS327 TaxID=2545265 RepID=UPI0015E059E8|nr:N-acetyl-1-D-myo-inositol-2-amino-2-deoxy-alpha-D-glucopyranoside deacetylase [Streptomyces sp. AJS327]MBA0051408.1 N-acetyl-1-D-myo-inositol-2-amino-2-deoxy-alpha-D-glucopyranoside deacetylase [Streptomyces sp. AJS327]
MTDAPERCLLFVHAHPDDESINNGATMAKYAAEGVRVALVTCTRGEEGEVIPSRLAHLAPGRDDTLGPYRTGELAAALRELGVTDHRYLGGPGRYRDSGMMGAPQNDHPECLWQADLEDAAGQLARTVRELRPQVLVTYGPDGGYGHPDHIRAHQIAMRAARLAADSGHEPEAGVPHTVRRIYWNCLRRTGVAAELARLREDAAAGRWPTVRAEGPTEMSFAGVAELSDLPGVVDDATVDVLVDASDYADAKARAMAAHATQIVVDAPWFALSNGRWQPLVAVEGYQLAEPHSGAPRGEADDLFAGVNV